MRNELLTGLFGLGGALLGSFVGALASIWATRQQIDSVKHSLKIDIIKKQMDEIAFVKQKMSEIRTPDLSGQSKNEQFSAYMQMFADQAREFLTIQHYFGADLTNDVEGCLSKREDLILRSNTKLPIKNGELESLLNQAVSVDKEMKIAMKNKLTILQGKLTELLEI